MSSSQTRVLFSAEAIGLVHRLIKTALLCPVHQSRDIELAKSVRFIIRCRWIFYAVSGNRFFLRAKKILRDHLLLCVLMEEFLHQITKSCQALLVCVKHLGVTARSGEEDEIVQGIQQTAACVVSLSTFFEEPERPDDLDPVFLQQVQTLVDETRVHVVAYIRQSKKVFSNPLDYMTLQEFDKIKRLVR